MAVSETLDEAPLWPELERLYATPPRVYHTLDHVREVLERWTEVDRDLGWEHPRETRLALLFHDAIYEVGRADNEARSARVAAEIIDRFDIDADAAMVSRLIELTARHGQLDPAALSADEALLVDCDAAILGADPEAFDAYDAAVRAEYTARVPAELFDAGRREFLEALLGAERIFASDYFRDRLEARARDNIRRRLELASG